MYLVIGRKDCIYCQQALSHLKALNKHMMFIDIKNDPNNNQKRFMKYIPKSYNFVPKILHINKNKIKFVGGYTDVKKFINDGETLKKTKKVTKTGKCSPRGLTNKKKHNTCYDKKGLIELIESFNSSYPDQKIRYSKNENVNSLWDKIDSKLENACSDEGCWAVVTKRHDLFKDYFRPQRPRSWKNNPREWLSTVDIEDVLNQYEIVYPEFKFLGSVPIDFDTRLAPGVCVDKTLCSFELGDYLKKGKTKFGTVYNLDKHYESGSHWICSYIDCEKKHIYFFDSVALEPPNEIQKFIDKVIEQGKKNNINFKVFKNKYVHQTKDTECGVYCINFIVSMLENVKFNDYVSTYKNDDNMFKNREKYFT
jgi:glutaredoxin